MMASHARRPTAPRGRGGRAGCRLLGSAAVSALLCGALVAGAEAGTLGAKKSRVAARFAPPEAALTVAKLKRVEARTGAAALEFLDATSLRVARTLTGPASARLFVAAALEQALIHFGDDPGIRGNKQRLDRLRATVAGMRTAGYAADHPRMQKAQSEAEVADQELSESLRRKIETTRNWIHVNGGDQAPVPTSAKAAGDLAIRYNDRFSDLEELHHALEATVYDDLPARARAAGVDRFLILRYEAALRKAERFQSTEIDHDPAPGEWEVTDELWMLREYLEQAVFRTRERWNLERGVIKDGLQDAIELHMTLHAKEKVGRTDPVSDGNPVR